MKTKQSSIAAYITAFLLQGLPFRVSHEIAGEVVALAENKNTVIDQLPAEEIAALNPIFGDGSGTTCQRISLRTINHKLMKSEVPLGPIFYH